MKTIIKESVWFGKNIMSHGWGNGYVLIPKDNLLHGLEYDKINVSVHGGLTFSEEVTEKLLTHFPELSNDDIGGWLVGFDTAHGGDNEENCSMKYVIEQTESLKEQLMNYPRDHKTELLYEWTALKQIEEQAKARRDKISNELSGFYGIPSGKKSCTIKEDDFSIELKEAEKVEVDQEECTVLFASFEPNQLPFRVKYELDAGKYKALKEISPAFYDRCSQAVTITPGKVSVKVVKNV